MAYASSFSADLDKLIFHPAEVGIDTDSLKNIYKADHAYVNKLVENILSQAEQKKARLENIRRSSTRTLRRNIQNLATGTQVFVEEFSGIFDIIKGIDSRAGSIAYGTFSLLLMVAKNKQQHEDVITSTLEDLGRWLSRLRAIEKSEYDSDDAILQFVLKIYIKVIDFGRDAVLYYGSSSSKRVFQAVARLARSASEKQAGEIRSLIADLMQELLIIQHDRIRTIKSHLEREQQERHEQRVDNLERLFGVSSDLRAKNMIQESNRRFDGMFSKGKPKAGFARIAPQLEQISLDALSERLEYKSWMANSSSCLLLLEGENYDAYDTSPRLCWLSPVAVQFYQYFDELKNCYILYHFIDEGAREFEGSETGVGVMLKSIMLQLLRENQDVCKKLFDRIQHLSTPPAAEQEILFGILHHVLRTFSKEKTIYIAVAGVENLSSSPPITLFRRLLNLIRSSDVLVTVKILVICRSGYWPNVGPKDRSDLQRALAIGGHEELLLAVFVAFGWKQRSLHNR
ncbi:uncharacterized protein TRUGW13939_06354 [Talaromyces rugulosus]|uniref:Fungal STAND N-terminal Goodbye domain-containing protein n=1 Tax=Talaromyces rugulosus TaxID=121627 RepID=A0A7H8QYR4_TALRU|nr:uncharacterized protein TRUGW13939_06354 [Talaromyces rugulosus]QKX59222.1 hypothetical protein TRUGW13939_06354 [Talaromyces rugulosus]